MLRLLLRVAVIASALSLKIPSRLKSPGVDGRPAVLGMEVEHFSRLLEDDELRRVGAEDDGLP